LCTDLPTINIINKLEEALGKPVITSNQASFWATMRAVGLNETTEQFGSLLAKH
jgi:maleate cis-trans isomerase